MHKIKNVKSRIEFVKKLTSLRNEFKGKGLFEESNGGWNHPYRHFSALRYYLILTCFDILGSDNEFMDFSSWLKSSKVKNERNGIFKQYKNEKTSIYIVERIYKDYNAIYGFKKGFLKFINEILTDEEKKELLFNIDIKKIQDGTNRTLEYEPTEKKKIELLFLVRNLFTHEGHSLASPGGAITDIGEDGIIFPGETKRTWGYERIYVVQKNGFQYRYLVRKWPLVLIKTVENVIERLAKKIDKKE